MKIAKNNKKSENEKSSLISECLFVKDNEANLITFGLFHSHCHQKKVENLTYSQKYIFLSTYIV